MTSPPFRFVSYNLDTSIEVARVLFDHGGTASADELAVWLGYSKAKNGSFLTRLANARLFGLVEGPSSELKATRRALDILRPDLPSAEAKARLEAFEDVPLYKVVLDHYHGDALPNETGLKNALETRWELHPDKSAFVLARLLESAEQAGLFKTTGDRSKMIRPTFDRATADREPADSPAKVGDGKLNGVVVPSQGGGRSSARSNKIIDGALDMLPDEQGWDEADRKSVV